MPRIRVLPDELINRIAAGEVVERPASVVKELVENSLDAESARIEVDLSNGGRSLVRVTDDGCGMTPDEALLALDRHATSKISSMSDLDHIATLGFRGEALPSIAAVSRFTLTTSADPNEGGVRISAEGGRILAVEPVPRARGTTVEVADLFHGVPARRKFLRTPETELRHAQETMWGAALARPDVAFILRHGSRTLVDAPPVADPALRLRALWRGSERVVRFGATGGGAEVEGWLAPGSGGRRPTLVLLVNGRSVRDRLLVGAVLRVLRAAGAGFAGARLVVHLRIPPDRVDVNVHPAKAEVRFANSGAVFALVERAVRDGVAAAQGHQPVRRLDEGPRMAEPSAGAYGEMVRERARDSRAPLFRHPAYDAEPAISLSDTEPHDDSRSGATAGDPDTPFGRLIGQYRSSFLLLEDEFGLAIVDQHVAHERVLYDRIRRRLAGEDAPSQRLLTPRVVEVDEVQAAALPKVEYLLAKAGIEAEIFGSDAICLRSVPPELAAAEVDAAVAELLDRATAADGVPERVHEELEEALAAELSCRGAIKINHDLSPEEQRALLRDLATTDNPYRCPHGRPIILRLGQEEMERRLGRR